MLVTLYSVLIILFVSLIWYKQIHKYNIWLYIISIIVAVLSISETANNINSGYIPIAFFIVVLFSGLLDKAATRNKLFTVRAELAIIGSILLFPHVYGYLEYYLGSSTPFTLSFILGLTAYLLMIPLTITSIKKIRRKMSYKTWKKLHRFSYLFFFLVGLHVILIANDNQLMYIFLFSFYFLLKFIYYIRDSKVKQQRLLHS